MSSSQTGRRAIVLAMIAALFGAACSDDAAQRQHALEAAPALHLIGTWDVTLRLERPITLVSDAKDLPRNIDGTITLLEFHSERLSFPQMDAPTHTGVYDMDIRALGFQPSNGDAAPLVIARTTAYEHASPQAVNADSLHIVLNPGPSRYAVLLNGVFRGDSIVGTWHAESFLGGGGTFLLRRHPIR
ncbi:MAG: hypothetical protein ABJE47_17465 [bacterium]